MATSISVKRLRDTYDRFEWRAPTLFGDGWKIVAKDGRSSVIVNTGWFDGAQWVHASIAHADRLPSYQELCALHKAAFGDGWAFEVHAPVSAHVNIHRYARHLWGRLDGARAHPAFGQGGTI